MFLFSLLGINSLGKIKNELEEKKKFLLELERNV